MVNKVFLIGNLGKDPDLRYTQAQQPVANLSVATTEKWTDKNGQKQEKTEWHRVQVWGKQAEFCGQSLKKGDQVYVEGGIRTQKWKDKEGRDRYTTEVVAFRIYGLGAYGKKRDSAPDRSSEPAHTGSALDTTPAESYGTLDDDIPF
jgi:single-strand DNA-binding protein